MERDGAKDTRNAAQEALNACRAACNSKVSQLSLGGLSCSEHTSNRKVQLYTL